VNRPLPKDDPKQRQPDISKRAARLAGSCVCRRTKLRLRLDYLIGATRLNPAPFAMSITSATARNSSPYLRRCVEEGSLYPALRHRIDSQRKYVYFRRPRRIPASLWAGKPSARKSEWRAAWESPKAKVDRLFDLRHHSRLDQIEAAFRPMGRETRSQVRPTA